MPHNLKPNLDRFEQAVVDRNHEQACGELLAILQAIHDNNGGLQDVEFDAPLQIVASQQDKTVYFCTRMAVAVGVFFADPELDISDAGARHFFALQRWLAMIFASSPYINADHILQLYNRNPQIGSPEVHLEADKQMLIKFCILYFPESNLTVSLESVWEADPTLCTSLCFALLSAHFTGTHAAFSKRHAILQWFPEKLAQVRNLNHIPFEIAHHVYANCSYDVAPGKHNIKKALNPLIRHYLLQIGCRDRNISKIDYRNDKPVMVVLLEDFQTSANTFRMYSAALSAARGDFYVIGLGEQTVEQSAREIFDEFHPIPQTYLQTNLIASLDFVKQVCETNHAAVFCLPAIGERLLSVLAANMRYAPLQVGALGYPAGSCCEFIDYMLIEEDYIGAESCFSETLLRLPANTLPYMATEACPQPDPVWHGEPEAVNIGISATAMQLNPCFLDTLQAIRDRAKVKIRFHFGVKQAEGVSLPCIERVIRNSLGDSAKVYFHFADGQYADSLNHCDMMLNPFPFGNMESTIDMVKRGLIGICKTGLEAHQHMDEGLFKRLGLPQWLIVDSLEDYIDHAVLLAENHQERFTWRQHIIKNNRLHSLYEGNAELMGQMLSEKLKQWMVENNPINQ